MWVDDNPSALSAYGEINTWDVSLITDMVDIYQLMPVIHPYVEAASGNGHGIDYVVQDYDLGVLIGAKAMAMTVVDLLSRGGIKGTKILADYKAPMTKSAYLSLLRGMVTEETYAD